MKQRRDWTPYLFVAPAVALFGVFVLLPTLGTLFLSFTRWRWPEPIEWAGLENYRVLLGRDFIFHRSVVNNTVYLILSLVFEVGLALLLALLLARKLRETGSRGPVRILRVLLFTPMVLPLILVGFLFRFVLRAEGGLFNSGLEALGVSTSVDWLTDRRFALLAISAISGWVYFGYFLILIQAGLGRIPPDLLDAARLETRSAWKRFRHVTLPLLGEVLAVCVLICATGAFRAFDLFYVLGGRSGGPGHITEIVPTWLVQQAFELKRYGYGCAIAVTLTVMVGVIAALYLRLASRPAGAARRVEF